MINVLIYSNSQLWRSEEIERRSDRSLQVTHRQRKYWSHYSFPAGWHMLWYNRT